MNAKQWLLNVDPELPREIKESGLQESKEATIFEIASWALYATMHYDFEVKEMGEKVFKALDEIVPKLDPGYRPPT